MTPKQTLINFPEFANNGTKTKPDDAKYAQGFLPADVLPAEWTNYFFNGATKGITDLNTGITSIEEELINVLTAAGIEPATATKDQVLTAIQTLITNKTGTLSNLTTEAKNNLVAALNELKAGLGSAAAKNVDTAITSATSTNLPTTKAVKDELENYESKEHLNQNYFSKTEVLTYIKNQLKLSPYETIEPTPNSVNMAYTCPYDGFISAISHAGVYGSCGLYISHDEGKTWINTEKNMGIFTRNSEYGDWNTSAVVSKGDKIYITNATSVSGRFYKERDYTD